MRANASKNLVIDIDGVVESDIIGCACTLPMFDHRRTAEAMIHENFMAKAGHPCAPGNGWNGRERWFQTGDRA